MKPAAWRFVVVADLGVDSGSPARVRPGESEGWLASLGASVEIPGKAGGSSPRITLDGPEAFKPSHLAGTLAGKFEPSGGAVVGTSALPAVDDVLHHPVFQRIESAWRGLRLLLDHTGDAVEVEVVSLPRKNLAMRFREAVFEPGLQAEAPPSVFLLDYDFTHRADDVALLGDLAGMAKVLQAPFVAGASAGFFDLRHLIQATALPDLVERLSDSAHRAWQTFQASEPARWSALTFNRYLQRAPYTLEADGHAETVSESNPESYLWGRGIWLLGAACARSIRNHGHALDIAGSQAAGFGTLPTRSFRTGTNTSALLATEVAIPEAQMLELSRAGFTPVIGPLRSDMAILPMAVTVFRLVPGRLTVEGTLAYQIMAGRLAQFCGRMLDEMPAAVSPEEAAAFVSRELREFLGPLAGDDPAAAVQVNAVEGAEGAPQLLDVQVRPVASVEGKRIEYAFGLPLRNG